MSIKLKNGWYKVESKSNPGAWHYVMPLSDGLLHCTCPAGQRNKPCHHCTEVAQEIRAAKEVVVKQKPACDCWACSTGSRFGCLKLAASDPAYMAACLEAQNYIC